MSTRDRERRTPAPAESLAPGLPLDFGKLRGAAWWIAAITLLGAALRLARLGHAPPGLNQDEAVNAWNAWCLLETGRDMAGAHWPVFYAHAIGDQRTTLFFYLLLPFQALFGLSAWSTRLPAALAGIACIPLVASIARRLFGARAGVFAALLLAFDPWHVLLARWGIEGSVTPLLALLPLALLARARLLPLLAAETPSAPWALAAGLAAGIGCYGYWSVRLWMPATLMLLALAAGPAAWARLRESAVRSAVLAAVAGFAVTFGPLAWRHLVDPAIAHRAAMTRLWQPGDSPLRIAALVVQRWLIHYDGTFLFTRGDSYDLLQPVHDGAMLPVMSALLAAGLAAAIVHWRRPAARIALVLLAAYPLGDVLAAYDGVHLLRSSVGAPGLVLLGAFGVEWIAREWTRRNVWLGRLAMSAVLIGFAVLATRTYVDMFGEYETRPAIWHGYQTDLLEASTWLHTQAKTGDTIVCTTTGFNEPWATLLVGMQHNPARWFAEPRDVRVVNGWDVYPRIGDWWFLYDVGPVQKQMAALQANGRPDHVWLIVRPGEWRDHPPVHVIRDPQGRESLWVCETTM